MFTVNCSWSSFNSVFCRSYIYKAMEAWEAFPSPLSGTGVHFLVPQSFRSFQRLKGEAQCGGVAGHLQLLASGAALNKLLLLFFQMGWMAPFSCAGSTGDETHRDA